MRYAIVAGTIVVDVVLLDGVEWQPPEGQTLVVSDTAEIGDTWDGQSFTSNAPPPPPAPLPVEISDRQFAHQLARDGRITQAEGLAFVQTGTIPAALVAVLDTITDPDQRFDAEMLLSGATVFLRLHPVTSVICAAFGMADPARDAFFTAASAL